MGVLGWTCGVVVVDDEWPVKYHPMEIRPPIMSMARALFPPCRKPRRRDKTAKTTDLFSPAVNSCYTPIGASGGSKTWYSCNYHGLWCVCRVSSLFVYYFWGYVRLCEPSYGRPVCEMKGYPHMKQDSDENVSTLNRRMGLAKNECI